MPARMTKGYKKSARSFGEGKAKRAAKVSTYRSKPQVSAAVKAYVSKKLAVAGETKYWYDYGANISLFGATAVPQYRNLAPVLSIGNTAYTRVGNRINVTRAVIRGIVNLLPYNATTNPLSTPILVKMWVVSAKQLNTVNLSSTDITTSFFDATGGSAGFQNNPLDMVLFNNPEKWHLWTSRQFELGATYASAAGAVGTGGYYDNSTMSKTFEIDITPAFKKQVLYDDATTSPTNMNAFIVFQAVNADGSGSGTYTTCEFHYTTQVLYKDV